MKKFITGAVLALMLAFSAVAFAENQEIRGTVTAVDAANSQFTIKTMDGNNVTFAVTNKTDFDYDKIFSFHDPSFRNLAVNHWVEVKYDLDERDGVLVPGGVVERTVTTGTIDRDVVTNAPVVTATTIRDINNVDGIIVAKDVKVYRDKR